MLHKIAKPLAAVVLSFLLLANCTVTNEVTGRQQMILFDAEEDRKLGVNAIEQVKANQTIIYHSKQAERIRRIGNRIAAVSDKPDFDWEFLLIDEPVLNAWALPGGKVAVYAKMASLLSDTELAAVLGHEVAHAVLRHGAEQVSRAQMQQLAIAGIGIIASTQTDNQTASTAVLLASLAAQGFVALPHGRFMELEADDIGTLYMARAGYDPRGAVSLWQTMAAAKEGGGPPAFLSTHPSDNRRISRLEADMTRYMDVYRAALR